MIPTSNRTPFFRNLISCGRAAWTNSVTKHHHRVCFAVSRWSLTGPIFTCMAIELSISFEAYTNVIIMTGTFRHHV